MTWLEVLPGLIRGPQDVTPPNSTLAAEASADEMGKIDEMRGMRCR